MWGFLVIYWVMSPMLSWLASVLPELALRVPTAQMAQTALMAPLPLPAAMAQPVVMVQSCILVLLPDIVKARFPAALYPVQLPVRAVLADLQGMPEEAAILQVQLPVALAVLREQAAQAPIAMPAEWQVILQTILPLLTPQPRLMLPAALAVPPAMLVMAAQA
jgi:hypothetical protein